MTIRPSLYIVMQSHGPHYGVQRAAERRGYVIFLHCWKSQITTYMHNVEHKDWNIKTLTKQVICVESAIDEI